MASSYKAPPQLNDETSYERWKKEVALWETFTDLSAEKRAPPICLSLTGRAQDAVLELDITKLNSVTGVTELIAKLDTLFLKDTEQRIYGAYDDFEKFKRNSDMNVNDYIIEFEKRNIKLKEHSITLPDAVLAYRLLHSANIGTEKEQLARATISKLTHANMKDQLRKIFDEMCVGSSDFVSPANVKVENESIYYNRDNKRGNYRGNYQGRGGYRGRKYSQGNYNVQSSNQVSQNREDVSENRQHKQSTRQRNPPDGNGYTSKCIICKSIFHWAKDCPDRNKEEVSGDKDKVILFNEEIENCYIETFLGETINKAILDSGCTETVCGNVWLQCYLDSLNKEESAKVQSQSSSKVFRFGDGKCYEATRKVTIPAMIGDTEVHIETQVVNCDLPLLLSKNSMQKARTKIDFQKNKAIMFDKEIDLRFTTSGHYYIPLKLENSNETLLSLSETSGLKDKKKVVYKLHKQFSHPRAHKLQKLLQDAGIFDKELLNEIEAIEGECTICQKYKKPPPKPIVTFPFDKDFNESVAMDIKFYSGKPILHLIDHATRFSAASVIHSKERDVVISKIFEI